MTTWYLMMTICIVYVMFKIALYRNLLYKWIRIFGTSVAELVCNAHSVWICHGLLYNGLVAKYSMLVSSTGQASVLSSIHFQFIIIDGKKMQILVGLHLDHVV
jgi:hypothetical protein